MKRSRPTSKSSPDAANPEEDIVLRANSLEKALDSMIKMAEKELDTRKCRTSSLVTLIEARKVLRGDYGT